MIKLFELKKNSIKSLRDNNKNYSNIKVSNEFKTINKILLGRYMLEKINNLDNNILNRWERDLVTLIKNSADIFNIFSILNHYALDNQSIKDDYLKLIFNSDIDFFNGGFQIRLKLNEKTNILYDFQDMPLNNLLSNILSTSILIDNHPEFVLTKIEKDFSVFYTDSWLIDNNTRESGLKTFLSSLNISEDFLKEAVALEQSRKLKNIAKNGNFYNITGDFPHILSEIVEKESFSGQNILSKKIGEFEGLPLHFIYEKDNNSFKFITKEKDEFIKENYGKIICKGEFLSKNDVNISYDKNINFDKILKINKEIQTFINQSSYIYSTKLNLKSLESSFLAGKNLWKQIKPSEFKSCYQPENPIYLKINTNTISKMGSVKKRVDVNVNILKHDLKVSFNHENINLQLNNKNIARFNINKSAFNIKNDCFLLSNLYFLVDETLAKTIVNHINEKLNLNSVIVSKINKELSKERGIE